MTNLTSVSTFGWFTGNSGQGLTSVSTFGWYLDDFVVVTPIDPDIFVIGNVKISREVEYLIKIGLLYNSQFEINISKELQTWILPERD